MADICDTCDFEDACPSAHFNKTESSICAFYKSLRKDKPDGAWWKGGAERWQYDRLMAMTL